MFEQVLKIPKRINLLLVQQLLWGQSLSCDPQLVLDAWPTTAVRGGEGTHCLEDYHFWFGQINLLVARAPMDDNWHRYSWQILFSFSTNTIFDSDKYKCVPTLVNPTLRTVAPISIAVPTAPSKSSFLEKYVFDESCSVSLHFHLCKVLLVDKLSD